MHLASHIAALGTESAFEISARAAALAARGRSVINLGIGQPDASTPPHVVEAACQALRDGHHGYTPANGILALREAIAADAARRLAVEVDPGQIVVVPGGKVTLSFAMLILGRPGVEILYPDPGFPIYRSMIDFSGATPVGYPLHERDGFSFSADEVLARITPRTRLLVLNSPANPTGGVAPRAELERLAAGLAHHPEVFVLSDEIYARIVFGPAGHASLLSFASLRDRLIVLDGLSKTYAMTGWRLGWGIWPGELAEIATRLSINIHSCVNAATQHAGIAALTGTQEPVDRMVATFAERREVIVEALNRLPGVRCAKPGGAFYAFPDITATGFSARELQDRWLDEIGVATIAGQSFGARGEGHLRFSYASSLDSIREAMRRLDAWLHDHVAPLRHSA
ncbi:MAG: pyridoxal phosphate-dependent aminotransferase [Byssovorax sp.]